LFRPLVTRTRCNAFWFGRARTRAGACTEHAAAAEQSDPAAGAKPTTKNNRGDTPLFSFWNCYDILPT